MNWMFVDLVLMESELQVYGLLLNLYFCYEVVLLMEFELCIMQYRRKEYMKGDISFVSMVPKRHDFVNNRFSYSLLHPLRAIIH